MLFSCLDWNYGFKEEDIVITVDAGLDHLAIVALVRFVH
jgi:hypothetical protein